MLWIAVGGFSLVSSVLSVGTGKSLMPVPRLLRLLRGASLPRFEEVRFDSEPLLFTSWITAALSFSIFCILIGCISLVRRKHSKKESSRRIGIFTD